MKSADGVVDDISETSSLLTEVTFSDDIANDSDPSRLSVDSLIKQWKTSWEIYFVERCVCDDCLEGLSRVILLV